MRCHICHEGVTVLAPEFEGPWVTSDCKPWRGSAKIISCLNCGAITKVPSDGWQERVDQIYVDYDVYHQAGGAEQKIRSPQGNLVPRSAGLVQHILRAQPLPNTGRILDVGCGNGAFLKSFYAKKSDWDLVGNELTEIFANDIRQVSPNATFHQGDICNLEGQFDFISMLHCLEHIVDPITFLASLLPQLKPDGILFIQVPNLSDNAFDLTIYDHVTHFTAGVLENVARSAGYLPIITATDWVAKEHSMLLQQSPPKSAKVSTTVQPHDVAADLNWLKQITTSFGQAARQNGKVCVFGSSISGTWTASFLAEHVQFFIDEDENRVGHKLMGIPIVSPDQVPHGAVVILPFPKKIARMIADRYADRFRLVLPK